MSDEGQPATFDLINEPWIPCRRLDGAFVELGVRDTLATAHELRTIEGENPLVTAALHRMMFAVLHRALRGPQNDDEWRRIWKPGRFDSDVIDEYLRRWSDRFDLFHSEYPFMQVAGLGLPEGSRFPPAVLSVELASGNNDTLFDHSHDLRGVPRPAASVARSLVAFQSFALGGGKCSKSGRFGAHPNRTHAPGIGRLVALIRGDTLFESLVLNLVSYPTNEHIAPEGDLDADAPWWERADTRAPGPRSMLGYTDYLTWSSRAVLVHPGENGLVSAVEVTSLHQLPDRDLGWRDPLALHTLNKDGDVVPLSLRVDRALWRDSHALIPEDHALRIEAIDRVGLEVFMDPRFSAFGIVVIGLANDKARVDLWMEDGLSVPRSVLIDDDRRSSLQRGVSSVSDIGVELNRQFRAFASGCLEVGGARPKAEAVSALVRQIGGMPRYWSAMGDGFLVFLRDLDADHLQAERQFATDAHRTSLSVLRAATDGVLGRSPKELRLRARAESALQRALSSKERTK